MKTHIASLTGRYGDTRGRKPPVLIRGLCVTTTLGLCCAWLVRSQEPNLDQAIQQHRTGTLIIEATPGVEVRVEQLRHEFWFGAAIASQVLGITPSCTSSSSAFNSCDCPADS